MTDTAVIVGEPMSTIPTSPSKPSSTSRPSTPISTYPLSDALKANPHPYPIRTTSTAVLSRSNSTASTASTAHPHQYQYQYYVPQSPSKESPDTKRHRYSKSLVDSGPKALPFPSSTLFSHGNRSMSSLSSSESSSPTKSEEEGEEENDREEGLAGKKKKKKRGRQAACRGGKVSGIVASFEGRQRQRTESDASSVSSASSFGSFTDVKADEAGDHHGKVESYSTPKRNGEKQEPTMEELLASGDPILEEGTAYDETVKLRSENVAYSTVTASSIKYSLPMPTFPTSVKRKPKSAAGAGDDQELSVEELLALSGSGASAWERDCCTVKRVDDVGRAREGPSSPPPEDELVARQVSPPTTKHEHELVQEMSETREMVRALSARVASVEAKIGEMEVVAGELEVRGRQLLVDDDDDDDDGKPPPQGQSLPGRMASTLYQVGASLMKMVLPTPPSQTRAVLPMWYKRSWACYFLFLGLGACAFVLREVVRRGMMLRGRRT